MSYRRGDAAAWRAGDAQRRDRVAEMPLVPIAAAIAAAVHDATGVWLTELPMTPERVLRA